MGVKFHCLAYDVCGFGFSAGKKTHFIHGIKEFSVAGFKTVNFRDRTAYNYAHGVRHIVFFKNVNNGLVDNYAGVFKISLSLRLCFLFLNFFLGHFFPFR